MVNADWDDVDAAVEVGGSKSEMVVERVNNSGPDERVFALRTVAYEPVKLTVTRLPASAGLGSDGPRDIQMRCEVGRFGDRDREAKLMENVARRLIDLRGVDFAPIR